MRTDHVAILASRKTPVYRRHKLLPIVPETDGETNGRAPARAEKIQLGRKSTGCRPERVHRRKPHNVGGDDEEGLSPKYGARQKSRFRHPDVWDQRR